MSIIYINPFQFAAAPPSGYDPDAQAYITAVEAADGQSLETAVKDAINAFFVGCKADGIFSALKASCILAGARTLSGALVPLVSTMPAPTNVNGFFVAGDYNRKTGLISDGSTKFLDSNFSTSSTAMDNVHISVNITSASTKSSSTYIGSAYHVNNAETTELILISGSIYLRSKNVLNFYIQAVSPTGFLGTSRNNSTNFDSRLNGTTVNTAAVVSNQYVSNFNVFRRTGNASLTTNGRISFYSIGEALDLALLDARVSTLMSDLAAAIP